VGEELRERLRRLRRETADAPVAPVAPSPRASLPQWFVDRAQRRVVLDDERANDVGGPHAHSVEPPRDLCSARNSCGEFAARVAHLGGEFRHGTRALESVDGIDAQAFELLTGDAALRDLDPRAAIYLDIETTGLSGGAGTKAFMVGLGRFDGARFELWQGFLREPGQERALLYECAERIRASRGVISFFGKSFDRHRLEDKMRIHGVAPPFAGLPHLDLFHPCRRLYSAVLADARLSTMERALCGVERPSDLPGSFAPAAWIDFLSGRPHLLEQVFAHNRDDVLSLVTLCAHVGRALEDQPARAELDTGGVRLDWSRCAALAKTCAERRRWRECALWSERAFASSPTPRLARDARWTQARALLRCGDKSAALELFAQVALAARDGLAARAAFEAARACPDSDAAVQWLARANDLAGANAGTSAMEDLLARIARATARRSARA
jgi:uncharacterized protein YprB with RNaseH-like and TPR domain